MLIEDYDIRALKVDYTWVYDDEPIKGRRQFQNRIEDLYAAKEAATDPYERKAYKLMLNTYSGSLGMSPHMAFRIDSLSNPTEARRLDGNTELSNSWDMSAFMTAYGRRMIRDIAMKAGGPDNVVCISTDAVVVIDPTKIQSILKEGLGGLRLERVMYNAHWWNINQYEWQDEDGKWHGIISGLPKWEYVHDVTVYQFPIVHYDNDKHKYYITYRTFKLNEDSDEE